MHAGTAEPVRVSPPEAVAYPLELYGEACGFRALEVCIGTTDAVLVWHGHTAYKEFPVISQTPLAILLVDDSTADRALYRHFLSSTATYTFLEAATGEEGLRWCQTARLDCLILD